MKTIEAVLAEMTDHTGTVTTSEHTAALVSIRFGEVDKNTLILAVRLEDGAKLALISADEPITVRFESGGNHYKFECTAARINGIRPMTMISLDDTFVLITVPKPADLQVQKRRSRGSMSPIPGYRVGIPYSMAPAIVVVLVIVVLVLWWHTGFR